MSFGEHKNTLKKTLFINLILTNKQATKTWSLITKQNKFKIIKQKQKRMKKQKQ